MKFPADMQREVELRGLFIEVELKGGKKKVGNKVIYFSNVNHSLNITQHVAFVVTEKSSDHEEGDT